jgi:hypothetical protein
MKTRSQTRREQQIISEYSQPKYSVEIDFDGASATWRANKKELPNGCYQYICGELTKTGKKCCRKPMKECSKCVIHKI